MSDESSESSENEASSESRERDEEREQWLEEMVKNCKLEEVLYIEKLQTAAIETAARFAEVCGRTVVKKGDILIALKFQAHESDLDAPTPALPEDPGEEADSDSDESVESSQPAEKEEEFHTQLKSGANYEERAFHALALKYDREWRDWKPDGKMLLLVKNAIDKTASQTADAS